MASARGITEVCSAFVAYIHSTIESLGSMAFPLDITVFYSLGTVRTGTCDGLKPAH
jgi:hypothetical protein